MITYVDTSTLVKLLVAEDGSDEAGEIWLAADRVTSATLVIVEARAALAAAHRLGHLDDNQLAAAKAGLGGLVASLALVAVTRGLVADAAELAEADALRGSDAVHLATALTVGADVMTSADEELCAAARRRGLHVANPARP